MLIPIGDLEHLFHCTALWGVYPTKSMSSFAVAGGDDKHGASTNSTDRWMVQAFFWSFTDYVKTRCKSYQAVNQQIQQLHGNGYDRALKSANLQDLL